MFEMYSEKKSFIDIFQLFKTSLKIFDIWEQFVPGNAETGVM